ncbi:MAG: EAL domain-containing protein, partial [Eubacteriales bacterium]|nr:EAL domain-containing protein [Eubacteriales bacterium]
FKLINETFGVGKGDELLKYIATLINQASRPIYAARFNADIFYVFVPHKEKYEPETFKMWYSRVNEFSISMDIKLHCGIYEIDDSTLPASVICDRAQLAAEKNNGMYDVPFFVYDNSLRQRLLDEQFVTSNMRTALEEHQYQVYYQPKYDLNNERIAGAEALVRWIHPIKGFLSPGAFIPLFETNGFITELDKYVWERACSDIRRWIDSGLTPIAISVNVSRADIYNPALADILLGYLAKYNVPIRYLHLEITESAYTDNPSQIITAVSHLRRLGFVVEMDDFGSGYSSLNMLAEMPVDVLKLDMRFIQSETAKHSGKGILSFVISLAKWLDLAVVAEGVETGEQIATLRSMDCNYVQGFYYAKPMQQEAFENLLATSKTTEMICTSQTARQYVQKAKPQKSAPSEREMLIVDDIEFNRAVLAGAFDGEYTIVEKENGSEAWDYLCENYASVDIVLLDLLMPVMDGFQLLDRIRADEKMKSLPVIITSQGSAQNEKRALQMQADDFLSKPYNPDVIRRRVHNVIASHRIVEYEHRRASEAPEGIANAQDVFAVVNSLKPHFDIVRLVEPESTLVCSQSAPAGCEIHACYAVWGKATRCNNCISLKALTTKGRHCKLEYSANGLYFVVAEYIPFGSAGAVIEMVTKLDDEYVDNVFDKKLLYANLDAIHQQMEFDELTGIYNRRFIKRRLPELVSDAKAMKRNVSVAMADIDMFKKLNDSYGHLAGDKILRMVADVLRSNLCVNPDDFVARFGGDEFLIVCTDVNRNEMMKRLIGVMKILPHMALNDDAISVEIGISSGCVDSAEFPQFDAAQLVDIADKRLYKAKESGRGNVRTED